MLDYPSSVGVAVEVPLLAELQRRRVFRALIAYGIAAFAVLQIIEPIMHGLHWPDEVLSYVVLALAAGFPIVVSLAWIFDVNAGRIERAASASATPKGISVGFLLVGIGLLAAAPGVVWHFAVRHSAKSTAAAPAMDQQPPSIAVLPFADMSPGKDQEYFSDGVAEEILNALAQVDGLKVAGRTSSFSFKGKTEDLRDIGQKLGVSAVLEGSVRRAGDHVRVTAQVIKVADGFHLWSQTFDRNLTDIFVVQDEVARAVASALKVQLLGKAEKRAANPEAYALFLLGNDLVRKRPDRRPVVEAYEKSVVIDPTFAPAWARLAIERWNLSSDAQDVVERAALARGVGSAAERAIELAPDLPDSHLARGVLRLSYRWDWSGARDDFDRAVALAPSNAEARLWLAESQGRQGRFDEAVAGLRKATELDPLDRRLWSTLGFWSIIAGRNDEGRRAIERARQLAHEPSFWADYTAWSYLLERDADGARSWIDKAEPGLSRTGCSIYLAHLDGHDDVARRMLDDWQLKYASLQPVYVALGYALMGDADRVFALFDEALAHRDPDLTYVKARPEFGPLHSDPRWAALLKKMNLPLE